MNTKELIKWVVIVLAIWLGFRLVSGWVSNLAGASSSADANPNPGVAQYAPNYYPIGVYGPTLAPWANPYWSSPDGPPRAYPRKWWME